VCAGPLNSKRSHREESGSEQPQALYRSRMTILTTADPQYLAGLIWGVTSKCLTTRKITTALQHLSASWKWGGSHLTRKGLKEPGKLFIVYVWLAMYIPEIYGFHNTRIRYRNPFLRLVYDKYVTGTASDFKEWRDTLSTRCEVLDRTARAISRDWSAEQLANMLNELKKGRSCFFTELILARVIRTAHVRIFAGDWMKDYELQDILMPFVFDLRRVLVHHESRIMSALAKEESTVLLNQKYWSGSSKIMSALAKTAIASRTKPRDHKINTKITQPQTQVKVHQALPWVRFLARCVDIVIFSIVLRIFMPFVLDLPPPIGLFLLVFVCIFAESALVSSWGTTPGKWLLSVELKDADGNKPEFSAAVNRSHAVWRRGLGYGIPFITPFTLIAAYNRLTKDGITSWDREGHFTIIHRKISVIRAIVAIAIFGLVIFL